MLHVVGSDGGERVPLSTSCLGRHSTWTAGVLGVCVYSCLSRCLETCAGGRWEPLHLPDARGAPWVFLWHTQCVPIRQLMEYSGACMALAVQYKQTIKRFRITLSKEALEKSLIGTFHSGNYTVDIFVAFSDKFFVNCIYEIDKCCCDGLCPACALIPLHILSCVLKKKRQ